MKAVLPLQYIGFELESGGTLLDATISAKCSPLSFARDNKLWNGSEWLCPISAAKKSMESVTKQ